MTKNQAYIIPILLFPTTRIIQERNSLLHCKQRLLQFECQIHRVRRRYQDLCSLPLR
jgi:hypothetical protein